MLVGERGRVVANSAKHQIPKKQNLTDPNRKLQFIKNIKTAALNMKASFAHVIQEQNVMASNLYFLSDSNLAILQFGDVD